MDKLIVAISVAGILFGIGLSLYEFAFGPLWGCFGPNCSVSPPFSYYLYVYYIPIPVIIVSLVALVWGFRKTTQRRDRELSHEEDGAGESSLAHPC